MCIRDSDRDDGYRQRQNNGNYYGNSRNAAPFNPSNQHANMACMNDESDIFHDDTASMHEHAAVLCFSDPPTSGRLTLLLKLMMMRILVMMMNLFPDLCPCRGRCP